MKSDIVLCNGYYEVILRDRSRKEKARAKIDLFDLGKISDVHWCLDSVGYANSSIGRMHRIVINASLNEIVDHVSLDKLDNRRANLRIATYSQNIHHRGRGKNNVSGKKGVSWDNSKKRWRATVKSKHFGYFRSVEAAVSARDKAAKKIFGEYAYLNETPKT